MSSSDYIYPIIVPSDVDVEDAFSSTHSPNYTPASPDYSPASPGNTSPNPSDDLSKYLLASLAISPFHDDPYMKVMQAYNATSNESPIPLPQAPIAPPTEILPPKKRARSRSSSSTSALPQVFEIGESSHKTHLERHEEQIETILNHLDELPLERIEHIEDIIEGLGNGRVIIQRDFDQLETELHEARAQIAGFQREQIRHDDKIVFARVRVSTLEMIIEDIQNGSKRDINICSISHDSGRHQENYCLDSVSTALKAQAATMANTGNTNTGPRESSFLCPTVPNSEKLTEVFIGGLPRSIEGNVTASKPQTLEEVITITQRLMDQVTKHNSVQGTNDHKRKFDDRRTFTNNNYQNNCNNNNNRNNDHQQQQNRRQETARAYAAAPTKNSRYTGSFPLCKKCTLHHTGPCTVKCQTCNKVGHYRNQCPKSNNNAHGKAYLLRDENAPPRPEHSHRSGTQCPTPYKLAPSYEELSDQLKILKSAFQLLKQKLCEAPILALSEGNDDFVVYCDASHQDYDCEIRYHPGKANVVADALSQKERIKPHRVRALVMTLHLKLPSQILEAQTEAIKEENIKAENLRGMDKAF
ncbi:reverse transcriptase domain-containing protein [Tanacetum coccineum]